MENAISWNSFGEWLCETRIQMKLSQTALANLLGCSRIHIWRLEKGERHPSKIFLRSLAYYMQLVGFDISRIEEYELLITFEHF